MYEDRKLQLFREHERFTSYIITLSVWLGLTCNFLLRRHHLLSKQITSLTHLLKDYSNLPQGCNDAPRAVNEGRRYEPCTTFHWSVQVPPIFCKDPADIFLNITAHHLGLELYQIL